ncbi:hypothetical protein DCAR_0727137 [Daucus carota subsp. sativus]|uniref:Uncharacterized protein n=1 Tax=Daucus carota subsp. sativus TaxID=79200 RepID=A0A164SRF3_DAUCS|nr:PREDICTED: zinc finger protein CONSTANS-LIKE 16-like [Daucus carota subsp. sativus]WOH07704.1 hypothetical protein DCAR_0727137 [Daucus carota subsp. sativus]
MESESSIANAVGGKTARACDGCVKKRARWYCAADDAFLCQACDGSVHAANPLAQRHERVRLKTASMTQLSLEIPSWHYGFTRKPRTPRGKHHHRHKSEKLTTNPVHYEPEIVPNNENLSEENDEQEQLIYRVPIFDPFAAEMSLSDTSTESVTLRAGDDDGEKHKVGFYQSDMDLEEFAADVENLLCKGLDDQESFDMETLGFFNSRGKDSVESPSTWCAGTVIKFEEADEIKDSAIVNYQIEAEIDMTKETFELNFDDYDTPENNFEEDYEKAGGFGNVIDQLKEECEAMETNVEEKKSKILLALDYEGVLAAWPEQKSAWMTGDRPQLEDSTCWPDCMGECGNVHDNYASRYGEMGGLRMLDGGREARVSRYREKRRTRLFSKKIRYEVRKLNAEKRPRIKGRFVKRANFLAAIN